MKKREDLDQEVKEKRVGRDHIQEKRKEDQNQDLRKSLIHIK